MSDSIQANEPIEEWQAWLTLIFLSIIWGTSFILIKKSLVAFAPEQVAHLRIALSGVAFTPFLILNFKRLEWHRWKMYVVLALTGSAIPAFLYANAQTQIDSATAGILNSLTPIFTVIIGVFAFRARTNYHQILGILIGFVAAGGLIYYDASPKDSSGNIWYGLLIVIGCILYGTNVNLIHHYFARVNSVRLSTLAFILIGLPATLIIPFTDIPQVTMTHPKGWESLLYLSILAVVSTVLALIIFYRLVQRTSAIFGASVAYLIPGIAVIWGLIDGESIGVFEIVCLVLIVLGVYLIRKT